MTTAINMYIKLTDCRKDTSMVINMYTMYKGCTCMSYIKDWKRRKIGSAIRKGLCIEIDK